MRWITTVAMVFASVFTIACDLAADDPVTLEKRTAHLEKEIDRFQRELAQVREALAKQRPPKAVSPVEAVSMFRKDPNQIVTVEFGVQKIGYPDGPIPIGEDPEPAISATWDNYLVDGGTLTAVIPPRIYRKLTLPGKEGSRVALSPGMQRKQVVAHIEANGVRVTGAIKEISPNRFTIFIDDAAKVVLYIKGSGM